MKEYNCKYVNLSANDFGDFVLTVSSPTTNRTFDIDVTQFIESNNISFESIDLSSPHSSVHASLESLDYIILTNNKNTNPRLDNQSKSEFIYNLSEIVDELTPAYYEKEDY